MNTLLMSTGELVFPRILKFSDLRLYTYVGMFVALDVAIPWLCHIIHPLAGPMFLPMFFFVLLAGILFGWRAGVLVGLLTPLVSYGISGMPLPQVLPRIITEAAFYGLAAGLLRGHFKLGVLASLIGAIIIGRLAAFAQMALILGGSHSAIMGWQAAKLGWPGIALQLILLPFILLLLEKLWSSHQNENR
ncbi:MAG: ECF transporter S component [Deltaproteobacteria bacterium]|nr:ECF transporter S component [Deltaproteobacteria bacterium]MBW2594621.1 ECF transporter S component [Deltaproteobacteria bacterium]MBW2650295.1 ECF transporter S component [Deltaproteobacteria bacterium]